MYIIFEDDRDPAARFEGLLRKAFGNCEKWGDPWGYAAQDCYHNFVPTPNLRGKKALSVALCQLIIRNSDFEKKDEFIELEESIWSADTQEEIIEIIDKSIALAKLIEE